MNAEVRREGAPAAGRDGASGEPEWFERYRHDPTWLDWFLREGRRTLGGLVDDIEDVCASARTHLLFHKLPASRPAHRDNLDAFVRVAYRSVLEDFRRRERGRPRVPREMALVGPPVDAIFFAHCLRAKPVEVIAEELRLALDTVRRWTRWLSANDKCPKRPVHVPIDGGEGGEGAMDLPDDGPGAPSTDGAETEMRDLLLALFELGAPDDGAGDASDTGATADRLGHALRGRLPEMRTALALDDDDRLLLRLRYVEGLSAPAAAAALGEHPQALRRREKRRLGELRDVLERFGIHP